MWTVKPLPFKLISTDGLNLNGIHVLFLFVRSGKRSVILKVHEAGKFNEWSEIFVVYLAFNGLRVSCWTNKLAKLIDVFWAVSSILRLLSAVFSSSHLCSPPRRNESKLVNGYTLGPLILIHGLTQRLRKGCIWRSSAECMDGADAGAFNLLNSKRRQGNYKCGCPCISVCLPEWNYLQPVCEWTLEKRISLFRKH